MPIISRKVANLYLYRFIVRAMGHDELSLSNKSDFYDFTPARSVSDGGDFYFLGLVRQAPLSSFIFYGTGS